MDQENPLNPESEVILKSEDICPYRKSDLKLGSKRSWSGKLDPSACQLHIEVHIALIIVICN